MNKHKSNLGFSAGESNTKSQANRFQFLSVISAGLFLSLAFSLLFYGGDKREATAFAAPQQAQTKQAALMPTLEGDKAREYLKQQGMSDSLGEAITKARYKVRPVETKTAKTENAQFEAGNPRNGYRAAFKADGTTELHGGKNRSWKTSIRLLKFGRGENLKTVAAGSWQAAEGRAENRRDSITEWFENKPSGLEHGFTIAEKPEATANDTQQLRVAMKIGGNLRASLDRNGQTLTLGRQALRYSKLKVLDAAGAELASRMELRGKELTIVVEDSAAVYPVVIDPVFEPVKKITASDGAANDFFGTSVSISGDTAIVGAWGDDSNKGAAYIFERNTGGANNWGEVKKLIGSGTVAQDSFGYAVSISGDTAVVGMNHFRDGKTYVWIFERNTSGANNWGEVKKFTNDSVFIGDIFGNSVSISGDTLIVGAYFGDPFNGGSLGGRAYIFERNKGGANNWGQVKMLLPSDSVTLDLFGVSVSISGDTAIVGKLNNNGSAYIFERNTGGADNWGEVKKITASDGAANDFFGGSVSISGDVAVVGAFNDDSGKGSAYIFERNAGGMNNWGEVKKIIASDGATNDQFGISVSISVDTVIVGAQTKGSAYIYERNTGGADNWGEVKKLTASDGAAGDEFGISVAVSGDTAIVGAAGDDNGKGSAHVFATTATNWVEIKKPIASGGAAGDQFGYSVSISGDTAIVGTPRDDSNKGAAYIFERNQGGANNWGEVKKLTGSGAASGEQFGYSVSMSGDTAVVGTNISGPGYAWIFERNTGGANNWGEVKKLTSDLAVWLFGYSVSISGDTVIVGAINNFGLFTLPGGRAFIFERNQGGANNWGEVKMILPSDSIMNDTFGWSVSISGDTAIVGSTFRDNSSQGAAYIFERNQGGADNWGEVKKITASDGASFDNFGWSVSISGDAAVVGTPFGDSGKGSAYILERNKGGINNWGEVKKLTISDGALDDQFGISVSISVDTVIVGSRGDDNAKGSAYIYERNTGGAENWGEVKKLTASDRASGDEFGFSVSISGDTAIVGAPYDDGTKGSAYVFNTSANPGNCVAPPSGLVAWYPGDGNANDISGNNNHGTLQNGTTFAAGKVAQAFSFDGVDDFVSVPHSAALDPTTTASMEAWVKFDQLPSDAGRIMTIMGKGSSNADFDLLALTDNRFYFYIAAGTNVASTTVAQAGVWYHVVGTWDATGLRMYVNGNLENTNPTSVTRSTNGLPLNIGDGSVFSSRYFSGLIDEATVYNRALSAAEIQSIFAADSMGKCKSSSCLTITLSPSSLPNAVVGSSYNQTVSASGGASPYTYAVTNGSLPAGLNLNSSTGEISGTPTASGTFNFTVTATDDNDCTGSQAYSITVDCPIITFNQSSLSNGTVGSSYSQTVSASGGTAPYSYAVTSGSLPSGLSLNSSTGEITGTPTSPGTFNFTVTATDDNDCTGSQAYSITIDCPTITLNPSSLPNGTAGSPYNQTISASGLSGSYTFAVTSGSLPAGLSLNPSTGVISGTPTTTGPFNFTVTATHDASGCQGSRSYSITIDCPTIIVSPSSLPNAAVGSPHSQTVSASGGVGSYTYAVTSGSLPSGLGLNQTTGEISGTPDTAGTFNFTITATDVNGCSGSQTYSNFTVTTQQYQFSWFYYSNLLLRENVLNQVTAGSDVPVRFTLNGYKGNPYSQPPTSVQISCSTLMPIGTEQVIDRYAPDPYYSSLYDFYQTTWRTKTGWRFTCRRLTLYLTDGSTHSLNFYFK